jgi:hypothetical protein
MDISEEDICPISHIPLCEIQYPVVLRKSGLLYGYSGTIKTTVYCGKHLSEWLKHYSMIDPITNRAMRCDLASALMKPAPFGDLAMSKATEIFLRSQGFLDGRGGQVLCEFYLWL